MSHLAQVGRPWPSLHPDRPRFKSWPQPPLLCISPGKCSSLSKAQSLNQGKEDLLGAWVDQRGFSLGGASELGSDEQECAGTQKMIFLWGMGMTGQPHLPPWRIMKKNSQRSESPALIIYSFIKHSGHLEDHTLRHPSPAHP